MSAADKDICLRTALQAAIVADMEASLDEPKNRFTEASDSDPCQCYHNMLVARRVMKDNGDKAGLYYRLIREHMTDPGRTCGHVWHYKRIRKAGTEYMKPREMEA